MSLFPSKIVAVVVAPAKVKAAPVLPATIVWFSLFKSITMASSPSGPVGP